MGGLNAALNIAGHTLLNTQVEIQTSSNNISNANNPGYSREIAVQTDNPAIWTPPSGWLGQGASVTQIRQMRDQFLEQQLMNATTDDSQYTSLSSQLTSIQAACSDSGSTGISQALGSFFDSWNTLAQNPTGLSEQSGVYSAAKSLAGAVQSSYNQLNQIATEMPGQIQNTVDQANALIDQIAQLNAAIVQSQTPTCQANELNDERYQAMDSLAQLIPVSFTQAADGMVTVNTTDASGPLTVVSGVTGTHISTSSTITGGQLGGFLTAQTNLTGYISQLNTFASTLMSKVNSISTANGGTAVFSGTDASSITASTTFMSGQTSAQLSSTAQAMVNLQNTQVAFTDGTTATPEQYLSHIQQTVGNDVQQAGNNQSFYDSLKSQVQKHQQSVSGVSMDEEMVNVIQFQQIYQAAAKVVSTVSSLMSTAISMVTP